VAAILLVLLAGCRARPAPDQGGENGEQIKALAYLSSSPVEAGTEQERGVTIHDPGRIAAGVNVYVEEQARLARVVSTHGQVLGELLAPRSLRWKLVKPDGRGAFLGLSEMQGAWRSTQHDTDWFFRGTVHHDISPAGDGFVTLINKRITSRAFPDRALTDNCIVVLDATGNPSPSAKELCLLDLVLGDDELAPRLESIAPGLNYYDPTSWDLLHTNTVEFVPRDITYPNGFFIKRGWFLICIRHLDTIALVDPEARRIVWHWGLGHLEWPHAPQLLESNRILVFDNGQRRKRSRVIELDPSTKQITWAYPTGNKKTFFSETRGFAQRLANGNTLVTVSERGHVLEVTQDGKTVWEFRAPEEDGRRPAIYRMYRLESTKGTKPPLPAPVGPPG